MSTSDQSPAKRLAVLEAELKTLRMEANVHEWLISVLIYQLPEKDRAGMLENLAQQAWMYRRAQTGVATSQGEESLIYAKVVRRISEQIETWIMLED